jgi:hypothetical protein
VVTGLNTGGGGGSFSVTQDNSFSDSDVVYFTGLIWDLAQSNSVSTVGIGIVSDSSATGFTLNLLSQITITAHGLGNAGEFLYLSQSTAGLLTSTKPTSGILNPLALILDANTLLCLPYNASKVTINFAELGDAPAYTGNGGKAVAVKQTEDGIEYITVSPIQSLTAGTGISIDITTPSSPVISLSGAAPGTDPLIMTERTTNPSAPAAGFVNLYLKKTGGLPIIHSQDTNNIIRRFQRSIVDGQLYYAGPAQSTSLSYLGCQPSSTGTISHPTPTATTFGFTTNIVSTASANNGIQIQHRANAYARNYGGWYFQAKIYFPDADYGSGATGFRFASGLTSDTNLTTESGSNNASTHRALFHISTSLSETTFKFSLRDGTTENRIDTTMTFAINKLYHFFTACTDDGSTVFWQIDNVTDGTSQSGSSSTNVPGATTFLRCGVALTTLDNVARSFGHAVSYCEAG